jgi:hypothetical protein
MADMDDSAIRGSLDRVVQKFTQGDRDYVKAQADTPVDARRPRETDEAKITANLQAVLRIASLIRDQALDDRQVTKNSPSYDADVLKYLVRKLNELLQGSDSPGFSGSGARRELEAWAKGEGAQAFEIYSSVLARIVERAREQARAQQAALAAAQQPVVRPVVVRTDDENLTALLQAKMQQPVPSLRDDDAVGRTRPGDVKSVLVVNGTGYHGANGQGGSVGAVTKSVIQQLVDAGQEQWAVVGCAEVSALDKYVTQAGHKNADAVLTAFSTGTAKGAVIGTISIYGQSHSNAGSWALRQPCSQCQQWLKSLGIAARTKGALS